MKKVLSVLLAAAMVMGMSVSAMAATTSDKVWGKGPEAASSTTSVTELTFNSNMEVVYADGSDVVTVNCDKVDEDEFVFHPGDAAWFKIEKVSGGAYTDEIDADWAIYIKDHSSYIKSAEFVVSSADKKAGYTIADKGCNKYVKITFQAAYDELDIDDVDFYFCPHPCPPSVFLIIYN